MTNSFFPWCYGEPVKPVCTCADKLLVQLSWITCDFVLSELVVLEGLFYWLDGLVVDVQQGLHGIWSEWSKEKLDCKSVKKKALLTSGLQMFWWHQWLLLHVMNGLLKVYWLDVRWLLWLWLFGVAETKQSSSAEQRGFLCWGTESGIGTD